VVEPRKGRTDVGLCIDFCLLNKQFIQQIKPPLTLYEIVKDYLEESGFLLSFMSWKGIIKSPWRKTPKTRQCSGRRLESIGKNCWCFMLKVKTYSQIDLEEPLTISSIGIEQLKIVWSMDLIGNSLYIGAKKIWSLLHVGSRTECKDCFK